MRPCCVAALRHRELQAALGFTTVPSRFVDRIFSLFDSNHDGKLTFPEFLRGVTLLSSAPPKERMRCERPAPASAPSRDSAVLWGCPPRARAHGGVGRGTLPLPFL